MGNAGLRDTNKYLTLEYENAKIYINVNKENAGAIIAIPCVGSDNPFNLSLYINGITGEAKYSNYKKFTYDEASKVYTCENADWSVDTYTKDEYNKKTKTTLSIDTYYVGLITHNEYRLTDVNGNYIKHDFFSAGNTDKKQTSCSSPKEIKSLTNSYTITEETSKEMMVFKDKNRRLEYKLNYFDSNIVRVNI